MMNAPPARAVRASARRAGGAGGPGSGAAVSDAVLGSPAVRRARRAIARPIAIAKPTATGVKELRPPDQMAAHHAARIISPLESPTPRDSPTGASGPRRPTARAAQLPNAQQPAPSARASRSDNQTSPLPIVMAS